MIFGLSGDVLSCLLIYLLRLITIFLKFADRFKNPSYLNGLGITGVALISTSYKLLLRSFYPVLIL